MSDCSVGRKNLAVRLRERVHEACADGGVLLRDQVVVVQREDGRKGVLEEEDVRIEEKDVVVENDRLADDFDLVCHLGFPVFGLVERLLLCFLIG